MYEDVLDDSALEAMWDEHPEAFQTGELQDRIRELEAELKAVGLQRDAYRQCVETLSGVLERAESIMDKAAILSDTQAMEASWVPWANQYD